VPGNADRDTAAAGAKIEHAAWRSGGNAFQRELHQQFGFGTRDQHRRRNPEGQTEKLAFAGKVRDRLSCRAARNERLERALFGCAQSDIRIRRKICGIARDHMAQQRAGINGVDIPLRFGQRAADSGSHG